MLCYWKYFFHWSNFLRRLSILCGSKYYLQWSIFYVGHVLFVRKGVTNHYDFGIPAIYQVRFIYIYLLNCFINLHGYLSSITSKVKRFSRGFIFASHFFNISHGFTFANSLPVDFSQRFIFANISFINVLCNLIFSWFVLQLVVVVTLPATIREQLFCSKYEEMVQKLYTKPKEEEYYFRINRF